jgi:phage shock protein PspC (stress-responsive transcriptional regulator)
VVWVIVAVLGFPIGILAYVIAWIILPEDRSNPSVIVPVVNGAPAPRP